MDRKLLLLQKMEKRKNSHLIILSGLMTVLKKMKMDTLIQQMTDMPIKKLFMIVWDRIFLTMPGKDITVAYLPTVKLDLVNRTQ